MGSLMAGAPGWWRRNALALVAVAVLLPATVLGTAWWEWKYAYPDSGMPLWAIEPGSSGTVDLKGATWGPAKARVITDTSGFDMPENATLIAVTVKVTPHGDKGPHCWAPELVQQSTGRVWLSVRGELGLLWSSDEPEDCVPTLAGEKAEPYKLVLPYVVPDDAEGPFWVDIDPGQAGSRFVRFSVDP